MRARYTCARDTCTRKGTGAAATGKLNASACRQASALCARMQARARLAHAKQAGQDRLEKGDRVLEASADKSAQASERKEASASKPVHIEQ